MARPRTSDCLERRKLRMLLAPGGSIQPNRVQMLMCEGTAPASCIAEDLASKYGRRRTDEMTADRFESVKVRLLLQPRHERPGGQQRG